MELPAVSASFAQLISSGTVIASASVMSRFEDGIVDGEGDVDLPVGDGVVDGDDGLADGDDDVDGAE